jgi:hypothetical protein
LSQAALEALVTGVALYPDPLLNHILDAAQHPAELRQAAMALDLDDETDPRWPASVRQLTQHSELVEHLDRCILLTARLGTAMQRQPDDVWQAIDNVRSQVAAVARDRRIDNDTRSVYRLEVAASYDVADGLFAPRAMGELGAVSIYGAAWSRQPKGPVYANVRAPATQHPEYASVNPERVREAHRALARNWDELSAQMARHLRRPD